MGNLLDHIGYPRDIWIDFAEEAFELLRNLANSLHAMDGAAPDILLRSFNDMGVSMAIITYFKVGCLHLVVRNAVLTRAAPRQCVGTVTCRRLWTLCAHGRCQSLLCQQHRTCTV